MSLLSNNHSALSQETHSAEAITESSEEDEENPMKNPFTIPPDIDIFSIRDKERKKAKAERERMKTMKIHEKMTFSTKMKAKQKGCRKALQKEEEEARKQATTEVRLNMLQDSFSWKTAIKSDYPLKKETFRDYINDIREILLLEYTMAVKRDEIQRLDSIAKNEQRKLEKAEHCLEKDAAAFDELLKENQKNSVQALKSARKETAAKTKKIREMQAITSEIEDLQSDISRLKNTLREYKMYRDFLYELSPKDWQEKHGKKHTEGNNLKTASKGQDLRDSTNGAIPHSTSYKDVSRSLPSSKSVILGSVHDIRPQLKNFQKTLSRKSCSSVDAESETSSDEDEEPELYFTDPQQLLSIFMEMEEEILSLCQNFQETEKSVNEAITTHESMDKQLAELKQQVVTLESSIAREEERLADLKLEVDPVYADDQDKMLKTLHKKVLEVYCCCTGENKSNLQTEQMLMLIEKHLSDLLDNLERIPPAELEQVIKAIKKEWRLRKLREQKRQLEQQQEERLQRVLKRPQATTKNISGRRLMFHSHPPPRKEKKNHSQEQTDEEKEEQLYYFT